MGKVGTNYTSPVQKNTKGSLIRLSGSLEAGSTEQYTQHLRIHTVWVKLNLTVCWKLELLGNQEITAEVEVTLVA